MKNNLPKLDFLYFNPERTNENFINRMQLHYDKFEWDDRHFDDYMETCSYEELIYLMIYIHRDNYPREAFYPNISLCSNYQILKNYVNENGRTITETLSEYNFFMRKEVRNMITQYHSEEYSDEEVLETLWTGESYMQSMFIEFYNDVPIEIIEKALEGKEYKKIKYNDVIFYEMKDSALTNVEVTKNSIKININEDKATPYFGLW
ncbi:hypothetical protein ACFSJW_02775 [Flavobacterium artemisiae]|uniref:Uncharacterized protein n=1 Tax=Flavobacterium artemisiae TaxID=2126556 RepID=A0ABW4HJ76_9FLAO